MRASYISCFCAWPIQRHTCHHYWSTFTCIRSSRAVSTLAASASPLPILMFSRHTRHDTSNSTQQESVKEEDPLFELELRQFRQRQEMEKSAKSAWQQAQRLAEEAEMQRCRLSGCEDWWGSSGKWADPAHSFVVWPSVTQHTPTIQEQCIKSCQAELLIDDNLDTT